MFDWYRRMGRIAQGASWAGALFAVVHRWLIDKDDGYHDLTDTNVFRPDPGETPVTFYHDFDVPKKMPLGPAVYHSEVVRWCNFWQWLFYPIRDRYSAPFTVE